MDMLGITEKQLDEMPMVSFDCLYREDAKTKKILQNKVKQEAKADSLNSTGTIVEDLFPDLFKKLKGEDE